MQQIVIVLIEGKPYPALMRATRTGAQLKRAQGNAPTGATVATDESGHLADHPDKAAAFLRGDVVTC